MDVKPIGTVTFEIDGERTATLYTDGSWTIEPPLDGLRQAAVADYLDGLSAAYTGPQDGFFGPAQLEQAAEFLKGRVASRPSPPDDTDGTVY